MKIVISQPRYMPAINYLQRLYFADVFILLDNVQRQARGFENRNKLLIPNPKWLSIPISSSRREVIYNTEINAEKDWISQHKKTIKQFYSSHPYFDEDLLNTWYQGVGEINDFTAAIKQFLKNVCTTLEFSPNIVEGTSLLGQHPMKGTDNIVSLVESVDAHNKIYVSGANGRDYGVSEAFSKSSTEVMYHDWNPFEYKQKDQNEFIPFLPFLDYAFNEGIDKLKEKVKQQQVLSNE